MTLRSSATGRDDVAVAARDRRQHDLDVLVLHDAAVLRQELVAAETLVDEDPHELDAADAAGRVEVLDPQFGGRLGRDAEHRRRAGRERGDAILSSAGLAVWPCATAVKANERAQAASARATAWVMTISSGNDAWASGLL